MVGLAVGDASCEVCLLFLDLRLFATLCILLDTHFKPAVLLTKCTSCWRCVVHGTCRPKAGTGVLQFCEMGPFIGFRSSTDGGATWDEPVDEKGDERNVTNPLFNEPAGTSIKLGADSNKPPPFSHVWVRSMFGVCVGGRGEGLLFLCVPVCRS